MYACMCTSINTPIRTRTNKIFRCKDSLDVYVCIYACTHEQKPAGAKILWMQLGVRSDKAEAIAKAAGIIVVQDR